MWVTLNGIRQIANLDYSNTNEQITFVATINATDVIMITHFTEETIKPTVGFKIPQISGNKNYYRLSRLDSTELAKAVTKKARKIHLKDASVLSTP